MSSSLAKKAPAGGVISYEESKRLLRHEDPAVRATAIEAHATSSRVRAMWVFVLHAWLGPRLADASLA